MIKLFAIPLLIISLAASAAPVKAPLDDITLESGGDYFSLTDVSYDVNESFVYTTVANFESGQACGIVFGGQQDDHYFVFNVDRYENSTKLLYFDMGETTTVTEIKRDYIIGNDKMTDSEKNVVNPKVRTNPRYHLKMVVTVEEDKTYAEFFVDNIKRFGVDNYIDLNRLEGITYEGGYIGYNVFNSKVNFTDSTYGESDYTYYTEAYRNQYHYSQYSHWNNDPNGLVYYNGYYHLFYQTHPYTKLWSDMYWGHARSKDLIHWQELPIALFPDDGTMGVGLGVGYAWSGIAMVYHEGMSSKIDELGWFPSGEGLLGYYTRDGERQDQVIITSDDEGITWTKRSLISQHLIVPDRKVDCRDPSIVPLKKDGDKVTLWGMVLSGGTQNKIWFLKSDNLVDWSYAGGFDYIYPECVTAAKVKTNENDEHYVLSVSSRHYAIGDFVYNETTGEIEFYLPDGVNIATLGNNAFRKMDYGEDSYAAQCFYIDDETSEYYGESVSISWFSGLPSDAESGIYETVRDPWNGGGMTTPVKLGVDVVDGEYLLTQKPITINNEKLSKTNIINENNLTFAGNSNILADVNTHIFEMDTVISNPNEEDIEFRVNLSSDEYTSFGWNKTDGYYVDRKNTSDAGISFAKNYHSRFTTGPVDGKELSFYVLSDNGGLELFCGNYRYNFYNLTLAASYSIGADLLVSGEVTIDKLVLNEIGSIWHTKDELTEGVLLLDREHVDLDLSLGSSQDVIAYSTNGEDINWSIVSGEDVISLEETRKGATITALKNGEAEIAAFANNDEKRVTVKVDEAEVDTYFEPKKENIHSGEWRKSSQGLIGKQRHGDGFIYADNELSDGTITANLDLSNADAGGILLRASKDLSSFIMVNYDKVMGGSKVWSNNGEIARSYQTVSDITNVVLSTTLKGDEISVSINGANIINAKLNESEPTKGYTGLNVCSGEVVFKSVTLLKEEYDYNNTDLVFTNGISQHIKAIYNVTLKNKLIDSRYYSVNGDSITLSKQYFETLEENKTYKFYIEGELTSYTITVNVSTIDKDISFNNISIQEGLDVSIYVGTLDVSSVKVNNEEVEYTLNNYTITISSEHFNKGENDVSINDKYELVVTVTSLDVPVVPSNNNFPPYLYFVIGGSILLAAGLAALVIILIKRRKKK